MQDEHREVATESNTGARRRALVVTALGWALLVLPVVFGTVFVWNFQRSAREAHDRAGKLAPGTIFREVEGPLRLRASAQATTSAEFVALWTRWGPGGTVPSMPAGGSIRMFRYFDPAPLHWVMLDRDGRVVAVQTTQDNRSVR